MKNNVVVIQIDPTADLEEIWKNLEETGCNLLYSSSDDTSQHIFCRLPSGIKKQRIMTQFPEILAIDTASLPEIDWETQWADYAQGYRNGLLHVNIETKNKSSIQQLILQPGPGFGDLSHATTRLVLKLMPSVVYNKNVLDVGCGSGILSLAAIAMNASSVCGIDIDDDALIHSRINSQLNGMENVISFMKPEKYCKKSSDALVLLMNMIQSEQEVAWNSLKSIHKNVTTILASGILAADCSIYKKLCDSWGWSIENEIEEDGWMAYHFLKK